jgi:hypothetical protein
MYLFHSPPPPPQLQTILIPGPQGSGKTALCDFIARRSYCSATCKLNVVKLKATCIYQVFFLRNAHRIPSFFRSFFLSFFLSAVLFLQPCFAFSISLSLSLAVFRLSATQGALLGISDSFCGLFGGERAPCSPLYRLQAHS